MLNLTNFLDQSKFGTKEFLEILIYYAMRHMAETSRFEKNIEGELGAPKSDQGLWE